MIYPIVNVPCILGGFRSISGTCEIRGANLFYGLNIVRSENLATAVDQIGRVELAKHGVLVCGNVADFRNDVFLSILFVVEPKAIPKLRKLFKSL